jgi:hypothetical protein
MKYQKNCFLALMMLEKEQIREQVGEEGGVVMKKKSEIQVVLCITQMSKLLNKIVII